jgi:oligopeptide transport system substrate-binding protein
MRYWLVPFLLLLTACLPRDGYFGRVKKPASKRLVYMNRREPRTLDPQTMLSMAEWNYADCLFASLVRMHPVTLEPFADLATHYERNADATRFVFYLRGNPHPKGIRLPNLDTMVRQYRSGEIKEDLAKGRHAPPDSAPARWSDGRPVTAHDFVYSWRRLYDPKTASVSANYSAFIRHSPEILAGKRKPSELGARAIDDWTLEVDLVQSTEFFLMLLNYAPFFTVPRQAIEAAEARGRPLSWTDARTIVTNGPFLLEEWRPYDRVVVRRNPGYWEPGMPGLDEIVFLPLSDGVTALNLYRTGEADNLEIPPAYIPKLRKMRDHLAMPVLDVYFLAINTSKPPYDNVLLRYALNMAIDRKQVAKVFNGDQIPARTLGVPALGYEPPAQVPVTIQGKTFDITAYDPVGARQMLAMAGYPGGKKQNGEPLRLDYLYSQHYTMGDDLSEVLRRQWRENLGLELQTAKMAATQFNTAVYKGDFTGMAQSDLNQWPDPALLLDFFYGDNASGTSWNAGPFSRLLDTAKATTDRAERIRKAAECDRVAMEGMALIPLVFESRHNLMKPYVSGLPLNAASVLQFKYAWVDTN